MNKEELYKLALSDVHKYSLLNEIFAIRDERFPNEQRDSTLCVNGYIGLDVLNDYVELKTKIDTYENPKDLTLMYMYCDEKAKDKIKELQNRIDKIDEYIEDRISVLTVSVDNKAKDQYFNNKCIGGVQELKYIRHLLKGDKNDKNI